MNPVQMSSPSFHLHISDLLSHMPFLIWPQLLIRA